jgi:transcriptional accessory protein Tex/SPT6
VFKNCCAFVRIAARYVDADEYDPLDGTRIHPEDYGMW